MIIAVLATLAIAFIVWFHLPPEKETWMVEGIRRLQDRMGLLKLYALGTFLLFLYLTVIAAIIWAA